MGSRVLLLPLGLVLVALILPPLLSDPPSLWVLPSELEPYRPPWMRGLNSVLSSLGLVPTIRADRIKSISTTMTGLSKFDIPGTKAELFHEGLERLCNALEKQAELTPIGKAFSMFIVYMSVSNRLALVNQYERLNKLEIKSPVFVVGMPRSGTTFLHNLLIQDEENFRAPRTWEITDSVPAVGPNDLSSWRTWFRINYSRMNLNFFNTFIAPKIASVHPIDAMNAEECMPILAMQMISLHWNVLFNVSEYSDWMLHQDQHEAFAIHKLFLQNMLSSYDGTTTGAPKFLLKAPWHMNHLDVILDVYPDAKIIMPHRDPGDMLSSLSSLHARFYGLLSDCVKPKEIGAYQLYQWAIIVERYVAARARSESLQPSKDSKIFDISFETELRTQPIETVKKIYSHFKWTLSPKAEAKMKAWLENDQILGHKGAAGHHHYKTSWFGLDSKESKAKLKEAFHGYCEMHPVCNPRD